MDEDVFSIDNHTLWNYVYIHIGIPYLCYCHQNIKSFRKRGKQLHVQFLSLLQTFLGDAFEWALNNSFPLYVKNARKTVYVGRKLYVWKPFYVFINTLKTRHFLQDKNANTFEIKRWNLMKKNVIKQFSTIVSPQFTTLMEPAHCSHNSWWS